MKAIRDAVLDNSLAFCLCFIAMLVVATISNLWRHLG
jgi:hypothetical protein